MITAVVTGAGGGIGSAICVRLLADGFRVVGVDAKPQRPACLEGVPEDQFLWHVLDIRDVAGIAAMRRMVDATWGAAQVLVNNAAVSPKNSAGKSSAFLDITDDEWDLVQHVNVRAVLKLSQAFLPGMKQAGWGRIVNIGSVAGRTRSISAGTSYMTAKAAVMGMTRAIAAEMGPFGITANVVAPGRIVTEMSMKLGAADAARLAEQLPVRRLGEPSEVAAAVAFLASRDAGYFNGAVLDLNGGFFMP